MSENESPEVSVRGVLTTLVVLAAGLAYLAGGLSYANSESIDIAGMSGVSYYIAWAMQVLAWPLLLWTHS